MPQDNLISRLDKRREPRPPIQPAQAMTPELGDVPPPPPPMDTPSEMGDYRPPPESANSWFPSPRFFQPQSLLEDEDEQLPT